jgi:GNAT superfamily N-acetyltransferase
MDFSIRPAERKDTGLVLQFIRELAEYEKLPHEVTATESVLEKSLFGPQRYAEALLAYEGSAPVGFAVYFHNFSTFLGKPGLYLEDIFIRPESRGKGYGKKILQYLAKIARERECGRIEWWVLDWNEPAINFYKGLGAQPMSDWTVYRLTGPALEKLADL